MSTTTSRNRNLLVIIVVLLLTNIAVLGYFLWFKKSGKSPMAEKDKNSVTEMLKKEVGFNEEQLGQYKQLKDKQREIIRPMFDEMRKAKDSLFRLLSYPETPDSLLDKASDVIAQKQKALDLQAFNHFKRARMLCTPQQQAKYDSVIVQVIRKMGKPARKSEPGKKN